MGTRNLLQLPDEIYASFFSDISTNITLALRLAARREARRKKTNRGLDLPAAVARTSLIALGRDESSLPEPV
jgi:hypothetical protein